MKIKRIIGLLLICTMILIQSPKVINAIQNDNCKISGDIVKVQYNLKKPIGSKITDKKVKFKEDDILKKVSYVNTNKSKELTEISIFNSNDILKLYKLNDDINIVAEVIRNNENSTVYGTIYDLRNVVWKDYYIKYQAITTVNEKVSEAKLNWVSYFNKDVIQDIKVFKCNEPCIYGEKGVYEIVSMDRKFDLIGNGSVDNYRKLTCTINNKNDVKYQNLKDINDNNYYMYIENVKDYEITAFKIKLEDTKLDGVKKIIIDDKNFEKSFNIENIGSGIEGAPIVKNGKIIGSLENILKYKKEYIMITRIEE
ncbi:MAG: hypothetical protein ACRC3Y_03830 [Romboutsia sp.]|uniref:hypothetical protein n=1 Tax=Romboutsia sp. TaxID=1965302 RepID=UPI003F33D402